MLIELYSGDVLIGKAETGTGSMPFYVAVGVGIGVRLFKAKGDGNQYQEIRGVLHLVLQPTDSPFAQKVLDHVPLPPLPPAPGVTSPPAPAGQITGVDDDTGIAAGRAAENQPMLKDVQHGLDGFKRTDQ